MYADDAVLFLKPTARDADNLKRILANFGDVTGLQTNLRKTSVTPINCDSVDLDAILANLPLTRASFPLKYLGLPLTPRRLKRINFQPLVDKVAGKLSTWNDRNLTQAGRACLVKSVLSSQPVYLLTVLKPTKEILLEFDKLRRRFLWTGAETISGGKCKVNWTRTTLPKDLGGLGVLHLEKFARALRLRWLWHEWTSPDKAWVGTEVPCAEVDRILFANCTRITLGNGSKTNFWGSNWLHEQRPKDIAPLLFAKSRKKTRSVASALHDNTWMRDLNHRSGFTAEHRTQFVTLWSLIETTALHPDREDMIVWTRTSHGLYTASSAYRSQFTDCPATPDLASIWKVWAPPKCKFFAWLILQDRVWTCDRLARRGWDHSPTCPLCRRTMETAHHLLVDCRYTRRLWTEVAHWLGLPELHPTTWPPSSSPLGWWTVTPPRHNISQKAFRSLALLISWELWKERNSRVFNRAESPITTLVFKIKEEFSLWLSAGAKCLAALSVHL
jgi:hypothetical protein